MTIDLKTLIKVAPFKEENQKDLLVNLPKLNDDQKYRLTKTCWTMLAMIQHAELKKQMDLALIEIKEGKRKYDKNDFVEMQTKIYHDFAEKLRAAGTEAELEEVREKLKEHMPPKEQTPNLNQS